MKFSFRTFLFLRAGLAIFVFQNFGCSEFGQRSTPGNVIADLDPYCRDLFGLFSGFWAHVQNTEFKSMHEQSWTPLDQSIQGSLLLAVARASFPQLVPVHLRNFLVGEVDDPQLYQLMERNFARLSRRTMNGEPSETGPLYFAEIFSVSVAFCLNGEIKGSKSCIKDFHTMLKQDSHFEFGQSTRFIIADNKGDYTSPISDQVGSWVHSIIKQGKDSVIAVRVSRASSSFFNIETMTGQINYDHPVTVYMHFPK